MCSLLCLIAWCTSLVMMTATKPSSAPGLRTPPRAPLTSSRGCCVVRGRGQGVSQYGCATLRSGKTEDVRPIRDSCCVCLCVCVCVCDILRRLYYVSVVCRRRRSGGTRIPCLQVLYSRYIYKQFRDGVSLIPYFILQVSCSIDLKTTASKRLMCSTHRC